MPAAARAARASSAAVPASPLPGSRRAHLIPVAVGRTATVVRQIPDSSLVHRMTRGRAWIGVLGVLLIGIVALNVATLSLTANSSKMERQVMALEQQNSSLRAGLARQLSTDRVEAAAAGLGMVRPSTDIYTYRSAAGSSPGQAADRLAGVATLAAGTEAVIDEAQYTPLDGEAAVTTETPVATVPAE